ncbi:P-loop containing nucleoside triphosphate hydrolase protein [Athelia psychrophila]|uniref:P-loop containing nucleoside triphosphate hydrolase protein n=1 Tax=Athelia psychrophila TaxID=1759441 RepID=A0A166KT52_9AGAM|nr:P-loop containing nucleoside triphosphate hydrolase protein [Fibularhizoctonia sp. CBS 109695]
MPANLKSPPKSTPLHPNIILFGQPGAGKSSLINMIVGEDVAITSSDLTKCTFDSKPYDVELAEGFTVTLWDTAGLDQGSCSDKDTIRRVCELILRLEQGVILLVFCLRGRIHEGALENYEMFRKLCHSTVPMVVVVSGLEREPNKVEWWSRNEVAFTRASMKFNYHACIVGTRGSRIPNTNSFVYGEAYDASVAEVKAIINTAYHTYLTGPRNQERQEWFARILAMIRMLFPGSNSEMVDADKLDQKLKKLGLAKEDREDIIKVYKDNTKRK